MEIITDDQIISLGISPSQCVEWVKDSFLMKNQSQCPAKPSVHPCGTDFITTMPALLPNSYNTFGVKVVSRVNGRHPSLKSNLMLFDTVSGEMLAVVDTNWITAWRTGAVAALTMKTLRKKDANHISIIGLGSTARTTLMCLVNTFKDETLHIKLMSYKDQAKTFANEFKHLPNVIFSIVDNSHDFMDGTEVVISCITEAKDILFKNNEDFGQGILVIPVHTRGFQNCDLFFDKVFGDDTDHIKGFKYFNQFKHFDELSNVLIGKHPGRQSENERILAYNIGLGLHDVLFAYRVRGLIQNQKL